MSYNKKEVSARLNALIVTVGKSENSTRTDLKEFSRTALVYVMQTDDVGHVNRMISSLTPLNKRKMIDFFVHFLPWVSNVDKNDKHVEFGKRLQATHRVTIKAKLITEFLSDEANDFWSWAAPTEEEEKAKTPKDTIAEMNKAIKVAVHGNKTTPPMDIVKVMAAIFDHPDFDLELALKGAGKVLAEEVEVLSPLEVVAA